MIVHSHERAVRIAALVLAAACIGSPSAWASADNTPTPYTKCMEWLDRDDVHQFKLCFYREMSSVIQVAVSSHNGVQNHEQRLLGLPRASNQPAAFDAESCQRTRDIARSINWGIESAIGARRTLDATGDLLRTMHGQIAQHASFRMRNRAMMRDEIQRVAASNLERVQAGTARVAETETRFRAMSVVDRCRQPRTNPTAASTYEKSVVYRGTELQREFGADSVEACHWHCSNNNACEGFTFTLPMSAGRNGMCQLMQAVQSSFRDPCCVSKKIVRR